MSDLALDLLLAAASFGILCYMFRPLEVESPAWPDQPFFRSGWATDLAFFLGQYLLWLTLVLNLLYMVIPYLHTLTPVVVRRWVCWQPIWLQMVEVLVLGDFVMYWGHRAQHTFEWLWRFHAVHHSSEKLDWLAAHREHPVDTVYSVFLMNLPAYMLGFTPQSLVYVVAFRGLWSIFIHSNVRMDLGPLGLLLGSPAFHHWHHDRDRHDCNFGNIAPWLDVIFSTHYDPGIEPETLGLDEVTGRGYLALLLSPFRR
jgi:sterol desaturase/sphingolipid hydroxylase (fatty acid hydroxylase superfamily)